MNRNEVDLNQFIEITLKESDDFLKIKETLTRIGIPSKEGNRLYQSCHILHKRSKYYIVHFKELFLLDGKDTNISEEDIKRRNSIAMLLEEWGLLKIVNPSLLNGHRIDMFSTKIIPFNEKIDWELIPKYDIGNKRKKHSK